MSLSSCIFQVFLYVHNKEGRQTRRLPRSSIVLQWSSAQPAAWPPRPLLAYSTHPIEDRNFRKPFYVFRSKVMSLTSFSKGALYKLAISVASKKYNLLRCTFEMPDRYNAASFQILILSYPVNFSTIVSKLYPYPIRWPFLTYSTWISVKTPQLEEASSLNWIGWRHLLYT